MWKWAWDTIQLEVPEEEIHAATESIPSSETTILMTETSTTSQNRSTSVEAVGGLTQSDTMSGSASNDTHSTDDWLCDICGRPFTHRHKLNRHKKYHSKPYHCLECSCAARQVAFSLEKDLIRHQAKHNGRRFYCQHDGCSKAFGGAEGGFTRKDNLKRHYKRHQYPRAGVAE